jgi:hypothetical protein
MFQNPWLTARRRQFAGLFLMIVFFAGSASGQIPAPEIRFTSGWTGFLDDGADHHVLAGGSFRYYLNSRVSIEPEFMYLGGDGHHDLTIVPNVAFDFTRGGRAVPYVLGGLGWMRSDFGRFTTDDVFVNGGVGMKLFLTEHIFFAPEMRVGWEPHVRLSGAFGFTF